MNGKLALYILIFVVVFFLIVDVVTLFMRGQNFTIEYYDSDIYLGYSPVATITTTSGLLFKTEKKKSEYIEAYKQTSAETFKKYFSEISKEIGKTIDVVDFKSQVNHKDDLLEIVEVVTLRGLVKENNSAYVLDMGNITMNQLQNSNLKVHLPEGAVLESVEPTPTKVLNSLILWKGQDIKFFPKIVFKRG
ncbi:DUF4897 domain-containing protein [Fervidobacterium riparium]|nr:hypothetical protein IB67_00640 [Fervidobacterium riparium]